MMAQRRPLRSRSAKNDVKVDAVRADPSAERNWLLAALSQREYHELSPHLSAVSLTAGQRLGPLHEGIPLVYFPQSGVVSILKTMRDGSKVEVGTIGNEGMSGLAIFLGGAQMPTECVVQIAGAAKRIHSERLQELSGAQGPLRDVLLCYTQYLIGQMGQSVACSTLHSLQQRFARWMLMTRDRVGDNVFAMTHDHLATLLGVRRAGISEVAEEVRRAGGIEYSRGRVRVTNPKAVEEMACECYWTTRQDFERLLGAFGRTLPIGERHAAGRPS
jgi:CRP-like cAMP-binding protein